MTLFPFAQFFAMFAAITASAAASTVYLYPGNNVQSIINAQGAGTTYEFTPGTYRLQTIKPKTGDSYIGQSGAILDGAVLITSMPQVKVNNVTYWVAPGPKSAGKRTGTCDSSHPMCTYPEDLIINGQAIQRVSSLSAVTSASCYFDYSQGKIYFLTSPAGKTVEVSQATAAFSGSVTNVTIKGLVIESYAVPAQSGAISGSTSWHIVGNEVKLNHGTGIFVSAGWLVEQNYVHNNGQEGVSGGGSNITLQNNEISYNNTAGFDFGWEAGGVWCSDCTNPMIQGNYVHDNKGIGIHLDFQAYNWVVQGNRTQNNYSAGIDNEIGYNGTARYNVVQGDGYSPGHANPSMWWGCGIYIYAAQNTTIYGNTVLNSTNGVCGVSMSRGSGNRGAFEIHNLSVHDNVIVQTAGGSAAGIVANSGYYSGVYSWNNHFSSNTYKLSSSNASAYDWEGGSSFVSMNSNGWESAGNDTSGTWISPTDSSFPTTRFTANQSVEAIASTQVWSLPVTTSTLLKTEANGTSGKITKVAGPIRTAGIWWWNVQFADGTTGWAKETNLANF